MGGRAIVGSKAAYALSDEQGFNQTIGQGQKRGILTCRPLVGTRSCVRRPHGERIALRRTMRASDLPSELIYTHLFRQATQICTLYNFAFLGRLAREQCRREEREKHLRRKTKVV